MTKRDQSGASSKIIAGNPVKYGQYEVESFNGIVASQSGDSEDPGCVFNESSTYVEFINGVDLNSYLYSGGGAAISATVTLAYTSEDNISAQFPYRSDLLDRTVGTRVSGSSNIAFNVASTASSKSAQALTDSNGRSFYNRILGEAVDLKFNVRSSAIEGDYGSLGINPLDSDNATRISIRTIGSYDFSAIFDSADDYDYVRCTVRLQSKNDNYVSYLDLNDYWSDILIEGLTKANALASGKYTLDHTDESKYIFVLNREDVESDLESLLIIPLDFTVLTGSEFEAVYDVDQHRIYSNFKVTLEVELVKSDGLGGYTELGTSTVGSFIIYTNARIIPDFIVVPT